MRPYLSSAVLRSRYRLPTPVAPAVAAAPAGDEAAAVAAPAAAEAAPPPTAPAAPPTGDAFLYDLFAVVCHRGSFQGGHYVAYVRAADGRWYLCDDAWVTAADEEVVRNCQAYMLFYAQKALLAQR